MGFENLSSCTYIKTHVEQNILAVVGYQEQVRKEEDSVCFFRLSDF